MSTPLILALAAIALLVGLVTWLRVNAFVALLAAALGLIVGTVVVLGYKRYRIRRERRAREARIAGVGVVGLHGASTHSWERKYSRTDGISGLA